MSRLKSDQQDISFIESIIFVFLLNCPHTTILTRAQNIFEQRGEQILVTLPKSAS